MITDEMVECAAKAYVDTLYDEIWTTGWKPKWTWETWPEENRDRERRRVRKALEAALKADKGFQELEAQVAAMREILTEALELVDIGNSCPCYECERDRQIAQLIKESLSSSAGKDLLERLRKLEAVAEAVDKWNQVRKELNGHSQAVREGTLPEEMQRQDVAKMMAAINGMIASLQALKTLKGGEQDARPTEGS